MHNVIIINKLFVQISLYNKNGYLQRCQVDEYKKLLRKYSKLILLRLDISEDDMNRRLVSLIADINTTIAGYHGHYKDLARMPKFSLNNNNTLLGHGRH